MTRVLLESIEKRYPGAAPSVADLDLTIEDGEFFTLLGPSGCGKSTTLRMVAGFIQPTRGRILFDDKDVTNMAPNRRDTGMVFQNYALFPHMSVRANVGYGLSVRRTSRAEKTKRVDRALEQVGLNGYADRRIDMLSGGQQQRVALARALVIQPSVLLLDEPLSNLDAKLREETRAEIRGTQKAAGITSIYVTHDQAEAMAMSDRVAILESGRLHQVAPPREVYHRPATSFVARFIGRSNVLACTILEAGGDSVQVQLEDGTVLRAPRVSGTPSADVSRGDTAAVSLRPESFAVLRDAGTAAASNSAGELKGTVRTAEFTGAVNVYEVDWNGNNLVVSVPDSEDRVQPGDPVVLAPHPDRVWLVAP
ncbi:ABC transporter ATP-binding protein [Arthrobacter sp. Helios]|uniref:ABC transporter ATP-binding protein n=1 Tax=Arthrobacter sp. Helios TaxID=2828862 RepID=UPI00205792F0|nr:ABC transporter ATP-binding protein [Arthrobacter sp. Helios]UPO77426.1 ABC transporter ATP-binding protein [Arthrobacter sp. Helios]